MERLDEDEREGLLQKKRKSSLDRKSRTSCSQSSVTKHSRDNASPDHRRNSRDRSPPRSFRERPHHRHFSPVSDKKSEVSHSNRSKPTQSNTSERLSSTIENVSENVNSTSKHGQEDVEEGEASDDDAPSVQTPGLTQVKRKKDRSQTPKPVRFFICFC